jgi:hypothetical protein
MWSVSTVRNMSGREKFVISENMSNYSGSGTAPRRYEVVAKYVPDSLTTPITSVQIISTSSQDFAIGSEVVVLGYDDDEADSGTDNFWQQIASGTDSSGSLTTGAFTAKKYMLVTTHLNASSNASGAMQFNTDVDSHYNARFSEDGGDDSDWGLAGGIAFGRACSSNSPSFGTTFIVNKSDQSKLAISHDSTNKSGTGASDAPQGQETVGLWDNQLAQITNVKIVDGQGIGNTPWTSGSKIFVWGSD